MDSRMKAAGRYAPSPTGELHIGNLRTAVLAYVIACQDGLSFRIRIDDIEGIRNNCDHTQLHDLQILGLTWEEPVAYQSDFSCDHTRAIETLQEMNVVFECYCSRKDIREALNAPHGLSPDHIYPGTCINLSDNARKQARQRLADQGRAPALRLRPPNNLWTISDMFNGKYQSEIGAPVMRRGDNMPAYNLTVVVDDYAQNITQVVRGDDLLSSTPTQAYIAHLLGYDHIEYAHVPLVLNNKRKRLAKRDGAVTLKDLRKEGVNSTYVLVWIARSLGLSVPESFIPAERSGCDNEDVIVQNREIMQFLVEAWDRSRLSPDPVIFTDNLRQ